MNRTFTIITLPAVVIGATAVGYLVGRSAHPPPGAVPEIPGTADAMQQTYTCSMHPQIRRDRPGNCPICEMPLILTEAVQTGSSSEPMLQLSDHALAMASVETTPVTRQELSRELRAVGKIQYNESSLATVTARVDGYAERLFVNFTGVEIKAGDHLAEVYSPDLLVAQQELLIALQGGSGGQVGPLVETSKLKLQRWGLTEEQIQALVEKKTIADRVTLYSPIQGTVIEKSIVQNSAFKAGDALYRVANLDTVWVYLDIYEYDLAWVRYGQSVELTAEALPGRVFTGMVTFVQPVVNEETRTVRVPVHVENMDHALKPGMFVSAIVKSSLASDGTAAPTGVEGKFSCPMHPEVLRDEAGKCPICEMPLARIPDRPPAVSASSEHAAHDGMARAGATSAAGVLVVPITAVLDSGTRRIVYVEKSRGLFESREVVVGPRSGEFFAVLEGVVEGERVVTRGGFLIDSQFQITGRPSLFYPGGLMAGAAGHQHGDASPADNPPHKH
jgi:Cu(I)/Ag(I) efflux system membrane fusion protein